jgi:hypothetical protein
VESAKTIKRAEKEEWRILKAHGYGSTAEGKALVERYFSPLSAHIKKQFDGKSRPYSLAKPLWLVLK